MKKILFLTCIYINIITPAIPDTMNVNWMVDGSVYNTSTCTVGGDIILPTTPTKRGYTFLGWSATTIPTTEYTMVEYLQNTVGGGQYIDTGFTPNQDTRVIATYMGPTSATGRGAAFGSRQTSTSRTFDFMFSSADDMRFDYGNYSTGHTGPAAIYGQKVTVDINKNHCDVYNESGAKVWDVSLSYSTFQTPGNLFLFGLNNGGSFAVSSDASFRFYSFKIYDDGTLIRDFIPVLDPNGVACMYDTVSGEYFYNAGTGDFVAGPAI